MLNLATIAFNLDRPHPDPLFVQLCDQIRDRIRAAKIHANSRLPPSRGLAAELGVSRSTVVTAYEQLVAEGYIEGRGGSGYYVCELGESDFSRPAFPASRDPVNTVEAVDESALFHPGYPDTRLFPSRHWGRYLARSARLNPTSLIVSKSPLGYLPLRIAIADYLADWRGLEVQPEQVMITAGSIDALEICFRTLASSGDFVGLENPGYQPLKNIAVNQGMRIDWLKVDEMGAEIPKQPASGSKPKIVVLTPSHQFPLGGAMPPQRRLEFQHWANRCDAWIIEDDYDSEFRYAGRPIPALASLDSAARTLYVGTFSKVFSVSLRLGYLVMPNSLIPRFSQTLGRFGIKAALPCQPALASFMDSGDFYRHVRRVRRIYAERRKILLERVKLKLADTVSYQDHQAGMQVAVKFSENRDDRDIAAAALQRGVVVSPLSSYYRDGHSQSGLLLGFCPNTETEIIDNIDQLAEILDS